MRVAQSEQESPKGTGLGGRYQWRRGSAKPLSGSGSV